MAVFAVSGSSAGVFAWSASWDDQTNDLTIDAEGSGRSSVTVAQSNNQMRTIGFVQNAGDTPISPQGFPAPALVIVVGDPPTVISNIRLKPSQSAKGGDGGFEVVNETWSRV